MVKIVKLLEKSPTLQAFALVFGAVVLTCVVVIGVAFFFSGINAIGEQMVNAIGIGGG